MSRISYPLIIEEARISEAYANRGGDSRYFWFNPGYLFMMMERERQVLHLLRRNGYSNLDEATILEVGCGTGYWLREFIKWGAKPHNIVGLDLLPHRVAVARELSPEAVQIECGGAQALGFENAKFDVVLQSTVFSSVLEPKMKHQMAAEMLRVVKKDGIIIWYDYHMNNPWNPNVRGVKKREIAKLFPDCLIDLRRITLAPPLVRKLVPSTLMACELLERFKIFNTHYLGIIRKS